MASTPSVGTTFAKKLKGNMGKLLLSTLLMSVVVILVVVTLTTEGKTITSESTSSEITASNSSNVPEVNVTTQKPATNASTWSHGTLKAGNGSVVVDTAQIKIPDDDNYGPELLDKLEKTSKYWRDQAQAKLREQLRRNLNTNVAKNIVYFLGDGMSLTTLTAARIFQGQLQGKKGEESDLWFQKFPHVALSKTYCLDLQVADSACSATAFLSGVKANMFTMGVNGQVVKDDCEAANNPQNHVYSLLRWAQLAGKSTGVVTNTRITHATPGSAYAHSSSRLYESDYDVHRLGADPKACVDIARQLIESETGKELNVIMGGGAGKMLPNTTMDDYGKRGERWDGRNLINEWIAGKKSQGDKWAYVSNRDSLLKVNQTNVNNLLGLFASGHMKFHSDTDHSIEPTLTEMTEMAMNVLSKNPNGYVLFVEGGLIDFANHGTMAQQAVIETSQFSEAIKMADLKTSEADTMIVVTSDHAHTMTISGYPKRGANILGTMNSLNEGVNPLMSDRYDNKSVTIISYAYGPGQFYNHDDNGDRIDLNTVTIDKNFQYITSVGSDNEAHGGDDVGIFARGPYSHLLSGVVEQNYIPHVCAYAACLGPKDTPNRCEEGSP